MQRFIYSSNMRLCEIMQEVLWTRPLGFNFSQFKSKTTPLYANHSPPSAEAGYTLISDRYSFKGKLKLWVDWLLDVPEDPVDAPKYLPRGRKNTIATVTNKGKR